MYTILSLQNLNNISLLMSCIIYIVLAIFGLINWLKLEKEQNILKAENTTEFKQ